ncbi:hypothetical protein COCSUDRAFT_64292 [Coccomyxa subellipsoidea C-169]|uniref:HNH nuclease domain-containing protein n=1 Tax=Coccomyxa subellipsoidea (strain C-169) TaxID=574566 RepID=I0ZA99_COCSC|nr:hypothetical protein COCSUDRAFT_64292 [Coccomyxa subellipsoidea C-169]EIE27568.1 hypothetical protein COCSUDRAFT_64292 [Coccomyxa subellipsoidea C-169]|eukprot:XP_005652112.1 hypothetical protein COCSUDRAFT_64292 [Coccomyxa subellipsoidea C-169]
MINDRMRMSQLYSTSKQTCLHFQKQGASVSLLCSRPLSTWAPPAMKALAFTGPATMDVSLASTNQSSTTVPATETQQQQQNLYSHIVPSFRRCRALVLDSSYRPIDVINWQRAICLDLFDKVDVLEYYDTCVRSSSAQFFIPAVLRVRMYVSKREFKAGRLSLSRRNIVMRDMGMCQYCGSTTGLTIDHVVPLSKGGKWVWENLEPSPYQLGVLLGIEAELTTPPKEWNDYLFPMGRGNTSLGEDVDGLDAAEALETL